MSQPKEPTTLEQYSKGLFSSRYRLPVFWAVGQYSAEPPELFDVSQISSDAQARFSTQVDRASTQRQLDSLVALEWAVEMPKTPTLRKPYARLESDSWPVMLSLIDEFEAKTQKNWLRGNVHAPFGERLAILSKLGLSRQAMGAAMGVSDYRARQLVQGTEHKPDEERCIDDLRQAMASLIFEGGFDADKAAKVMTSASNSSHLAELEDHRPIAAIPTKPETVFAYIDSVVTIPYAPLPPQPTSRQAGQRRPMR
jgi:hypothetical protein